MLDSPGYQPGFLILTMPFGRDELSASKELWQRLLRKCNLTESEEQSGESLIIQMREWYEQGNAEKATSLARPFISLLHERCHFAQMMTYPLGLTAFRLLLNRNEYIANVMKRTFSNTPSPTLPLSKWTLAHAAQHPDLSDLIEKVKIYDRFRIAFFERSFTSIEEMKYLWRTFHTISNSPEGHHWEPLTLRSFTNLAAKSPDSALASEMPFLTTRCLLETFVLETLHTLLLSLPFAGLARELERPYLESRNAIHYLTRTFCKSSLSHRQLLFCIDLALMSPCDGTTSHLLPEPSWEDVYPPLRFQRILKSVDPVDMRCDDTEQYHESSAAICRCFGWTTPLEICQAISEVSFPFSPTDGQDSGIHDEDGSSVTFDPNGYQKIVAGKFQKMARFRTQYPCVLLDLLGGVNGRPTFEVIHETVSPVFDVFGDNVTLSPGIAEEEFRMAAFFYINLALAEALWDGGSLMHLCTIIRNTSENEDIARGFFELVAAQYYPLKWHEALESGHVTLSEGSPAWTPPTAAQAGDKQWDPQLLSSMSEAQRAAVLSINEFYVQHDSSALSRAYEQTETVLKLARKMDHQEGIADALGTQAQVLHLQCRYLGAMELYHESLQIRERLC